MDPVEQYVKFSKFIETFPEERYLGSVVTPTPKSEYIRDYMESHGDETSKQDSETEQEPMSEADVKLQSSTKNTLLLNSLLKKLKPVGPPCVRVWATRSSGPDIFLNERPLARWTLEELEAIATQAKCGIINADGPQTVVNPDVRKAKYICPGPDAQVRITPEMWTSINGEANQLYPGRRVKVELDKINIYGPGDFFSRHVDAPKPGVIGSLVMCTANKSCFGGDLEFYGRHPTTLYGSMLGRDKWQGAVFLSSVEHEVTKVIRGFRISVTFLVKHDTEALAEREAETSAAEAPEPKLPTPIGLLLAERYSLNELECGGGLKGADTLLLALTHGRGCLVPVLVKHEERMEDPMRMHESIVEERVYRFTRDDYEKFKTKDGVEPVRVRMPFIWATECEDPAGQKLKSNTQSYNEYTGNESQPEMIDNLYYTTALLLE